MAQTTTNRGRGAVATPDLLFDTNDGGTALFAALNVLWTFFSDHLTSRYVTTTLANSASTTVTHNFGMSLTNLKVLIWESGVLRTDAQVAADYVIANVGGNNGITVQNVSGGSKTFVVVVRAGKLGINSSDFDPAVSLDTTGNLRAAELRTTGNDLVLNHDAAGSGADWTGTLRRPATGMTGAAVATLPAVTGTLATKENAETLALKTLTGVAAITLAASAAIDWAAGSASVGASIGANTLTLAGATSTVRVPGALSSGTLLTDSDDHVLNNDAVGSGADWKATIRRPAAGMTAAAVHTLPLATTTLVGTDQAQVLTLKDIDGGTASNTSRLTVPKASTATLAALTRKQGTVVYDTTLGTLFVDTGSALSPVGGGGGGGGGMVWHPVEGAAPLAVEENGELVYQFESTSTNKIRVWMKVPSTYVAGNQIKMRLGYYNNDTSGTNLLQTTASLVRKNTDSVNAFSTNQRASTNAAASTPGTAYVYQEAIADLTSATGTINSVAVSAGDLILVELYRGTDSSGGVIRFIPSSTEPTYQ